MFPQLSDETKPDTNDVLEHDPSVSAEGLSENGGATAVSGDGEGERGVNGESVAAGSELCGEGPEVGEGIIIAIGLLLRSSGEVEWGPPSRRYGE